MAHIETHIAIVGAGIGGLALARALEPTGARITILEQSDVLAEIGAGLSIWENGLQALEAIGLRSVVEDLGRQWGEYEIQRLGKPRVTRNNKVLSLNGDVSPIIMKRGALFGVLKDDLNANTSIMTSFKLQRIEGRRLIAEDGRSVSADVIIGADGVHSQVRKQLTQNTPRFCKQVCFRGISQLSEGENLVATEFFDNRHHRFGYFPLSETEVYWFDIMDSEDPDAPFEEYRATIAGLSPFIYRLIANTAPGTIIASPIEEMPPVTEIHDYIALMGDAAHPMQPSLGQGAFIALEDAVVLASCLARYASDYRKGIQVYVSRRRKRWKSFYRMCRGLGTGALDKGIWGRKSAIFQMVHTPSWMLSMFARRIFAFAPRDRNSKTPRKIQR